MTILQLFKMLEMFPNDKSSAILDVGGIDIDECVNNGCTVYVVVEPNKEVDSDNS